MRALLICAKVVVYKYHPTVARDDTCGRTSA